MAAPMRIQRSAARRAGARGPSPGARGGGRGDDLKYYLDRLLKMIPAEVVSLYLIGQGLIPTDNSVAMIVWAVVCLAGVVALRAYGTADPQASQPTDWTHVAISSAAFVIWVYTIGGPFAAWGIALPWLGSLLVLAWTFFVPILYKGP